ncbi:MAG: mechanosensitive ion channel family protein [Opitutaceae bacterium]|nr:mechanosensitive ion channel family protein [Verrucomicrobiales bacterium]
MKLKFQHFFRGYVFVLVTVLLWSVWANGQGTTNITASTNATPITVATPTNALVDAALTFGLDKVDFLQGKLWGNPLWQYIASLLYIFLAFYVSKVLDYLTRVWLKKWASKTSSTLDDLLLDLLNGPIKVVAFVIFLHIGLRVFAWPAWVEEILSKGLKVVVACSLTYLIVKAIDLFLNYWKNRTVNVDKSFDDQLFPIVRKSLKAFVVVVAVLTTSKHLGLDITSILASVSVVGLALGLAAQDTVSNFFGAIVVFVDKPFRIGDQIKLDAVEGTVETIGLRSTRVRNLDGHLVTIPNKTMGNATITNITRRPNIKTEMNIGITYDTPIEKVKLAVTILEEIYGSHAMTEDLIVSFNKFAGSSLNILVVHWWKSLDMKAYLAGMQELNLKIKTRFDAEGIEFAFPSQTVYHKVDSDVRVATGQQPLPTK